MDKEKKLKEMDSKINKLFTKHDKLQIEGKDKYRGGEFDACLAELRKLTKERAELAGIVIKNLKYKA